MTNFKITEAIFNEIQEVENTWEGYENNPYALTQLAYKEMDQEEIDNDDAVFETLDNIIFIGSISKKGLLYDALVKWYEHKGDNIEKEIRSYVEDNESIYYVTGYGYNTIDADLLGGKGDGMARKEFMQWINN